MGLCATDEEMTRLALAMASQNQRDRGILYGESSQSIQVFWFFCLPRFFLSLESNLVR